MKRILLLMVVMGLVGLPASAQKDENDRIENSRELASGTHAPAQASAGPSRIRPNPAGSGVERRRSAQVGTMSAQSRWRSGQVARTS